MRTRFRRKSRLGLAVLFFCTGCEAIDFWAAPTPTPEQYEKGLIVFYPGTANLNIELFGFFYAFREAGIDLAIEQVSWSEYLETINNPPGVQKRISDKAIIEADRIAQYIRSHPNSPVTIVTYSGGAVFAVRVGAAMPDDAPLDRIVTLSPGIWRGTDLTATLEHTTLGMVNYWSPTDTGPILISELLGLADGTKLEPAASFGFDQEHEKLIQVSWTPEMAAFGNNGGHLDFLVNLPWTKTYVVPWLITEKP